MKEIWKYKKLGEICSKITDGSHNPPKGVPSSNFIMISSQNVYNDRIEINDVRYLSEDDFNREDKRTKVRANDVLLTIVGTVGRCAVVSEEIGSITLQRSVAVLTPKPSVNSRYLMYCCIGHNDALNTNAHGIAQKGIYLKQLSELKIPIPPLETQGRIVSELDLLQSIIDKQQAQLKELDNLAQSIFFDMFGDPVENDKGWEVKHVDEIGEIVSGSTPSTADESNWDGNVNWITPAEMGVQLYYGETQRKITEKAAKRLTLMPVGTLLLSSRAPIGKLAIATVPMCCNQGFKNIICGKSVVNVFMYYYLMLTMDNVVALGRGATFKEVSKQAISAYKTIVPPLSIQHSFVEKIHAIEKQKANISKSIEETQKLFDYTMDKYFG